MRLEQVYASASFFYDSWRLNSVLNLIQRLITLFWRVYVDWNVSGIMFLLCHWLSNHGQPARGGSPAWGLGERLTTPHRKKIQFVTKCYTGPHNLGSCEHSNEPSRFINEVNFLTKWVTISFSRRTLLLVVIFYLFVNFSRHLYLGLVALCIPRRSPFC
jgi:hypothetical protein